MKIVILTDYYPPDKLGGVGEIAKNLKNEYEKYGHEVLILTTGKSKDDPSIKRVTSNLILGVLLNNIQILRLLRKEDVKLIHMHQSTTTLFLLSKYLPGFRKSFPIVINSFQVSYFSEFQNIRKIKIQGKIFRPTVKEYLEKWIFAPFHIIFDFIGYIFADRITVVSNENKKEFQKSYGKVSKKHIYLIPNGINIEQFKPQAPKLPKNLQIKLVDKKVLLYVGVFRSRKRVFNLLFALKNIIAEHKNIMLLLVGGGRDYEKDILKLVQELKLENCVTFVGKIPNEKVADYLNASDIFCLLSSYEGMPIAILEAMSTGKAILSSKVSGMIDLVDKKSGLLAEVDNIQDITSKLNLMLSKPHLIDSMGKASRRRVESHFQWSDVAEKYLELL